MHKGLLSSILWGANPWYLVIILTFYYMPSILSDSIRGTIWYNDEGGLAIGISTFACSIGSWDCCPYSKIGNCCLWLNTLKILILSSLSQIMLCNVVETYYYLSMLDIISIFSLSHFWIFDIILFLSPSEHGLHSLGN